MRHLISLLPRLRALQPTGDLLGRPIQPKLPRHHLAYDRQIDDVFELQDDIVTSIALVMDRIEGDGEIERGFVGILVETTKVACREC